MVSDPGNGGTSQSPSVRWMKGCTQAFKWCRTASLLSRAAGLISAHTSAAGPNGAGCRPTTPFNN